MDETRVFRSDIPKPRKRYYDLGLRCVGFVFVLGRLGFGFYKYMTYLSELDMELSGLDRAQQYTRAGVDAGGMARTNEWTRSDARMVVSIDPITKDAAIVSILATRGFIPGRSPSTARWGTLTRTAGEPTETVEQFLESISITTRGWTSRL